MGAGKTESAFFTFVPKGEVPSVKTLKIASDADGANVIGTGSIELVSSLTGVEDVTAEDIADDAWYTLSGVKLESRPTERGAYLYKGKKYFIQ